MLTRRTMFAVASGLCASMAHLKRSNAAGPQSKTAVAFEVPRGACDTHVHIIGDPVEFPMAPDRDYTPPSATADELLEVQRSLKLDRVVIVTATIYGNDNASTLAAIRQIGRDRARGVALVDETASSAALDSLARAGITGFRLLIDEAELSKPGAAARRLRRATDLAKSRGWHLQISTPPDVTSALAAQLVSSPVPLVFDYFAWAAGGVDQPGFDAVLSLVKTGRAYVKLSGPYRLSKDPPAYPDLAPVVHALLAANPDRLLWGSGWPHVDSSDSSGRAKTDLAPNLPVDAGQLLNLFATWVPDAETRRKILVDNPARLYGF